MAYNTTNHVYYLKQYSEIKEELTEQQLTSFLQDVLENRAKVTELSPGMAVNEETYRSDNSGVIDLITYAKIDARAIKFTAQKIILLN